MIQRMCQLRVNMSCSLSIDWLVARSYLVSCKFINNIQKLFMQLDWVLHLSQLCCCISCAAAVLIEA